MSEELEKGALGTPEVTELDNPGPESDTDDIEVDGQEVGEEEETTEEPTFYTQEQVESAVKTRVNTFNRKIEKMKPYETAVKKISEITGLSVDALINRLEGLSDIEQAKILGVSPQQLTQQKRTMQVTKEATEKNLKLQRELEEQKFVADPKHKDYSLYKEEVQELMDENPKLTLGQAYMLAKGEISNQAAARDAEQRAIAKMTKSSNQRVIKPGLTSTRNTPKLDNTTVSAAKRVGMDPAEYAAFSNISDLDQFEKFKASKKG